MHRSLLLVGLLVGCRRDKEGTPLPAAGAMEPVSVIWEGAEFPGSAPSVLRLNDAWHLYFAAREGSFVGAMHATADDELNFTLQSSHRIVDELTPSSSDAVRSVAAFASGSRAHLLLNLESAAGTAVHHGTSTDGHSFALDDAAALSATPPASVAASGGLFDAAEITALLRADDGSGDAPVVMVTRSDDGGATFDTPAIALSPDDLPTPWRSSTVGAGGMWSAVIAGNDDGSYNMLFLGAGPNGSEAIGVGQAWSGDGESWSSEGDLWYAPEDGQTVNGLGLVAWEGGYELWLGISASDANPLDSGSFYHTRIE